MRVLILCTGNSCRSQMAHGILQSLDDTIEVCSAGTHPVEQVNPNAIAVMREIGIDISEHTPTDVRQYLTQEWDYVITVCGNANETCPVFAGHVKHRLHIGFDDPSDVTGTPDFIKNEFRRVRDNIKPETAISAALAGQAYLSYFLADGRIPDRTISGWELLAFLTDALQEEDGLGSLLPDGALTVLDGALAQLEKAKALFRGERYTRMLLSVDLPNEGADSAAFVKALGAILTDVVGSDARAAGEIISTSDLTSTFSHDNLLISVFTLVSVFAIVLLLFRSLSLPILLVSVIQGAIFIAMAVAGAIEGAMGGIFFMSYIVSVCILMGATIDYGILMSSNYLDARREHDRGDALKLAVAAAMPTVFSSGLILSVCGFVIHFLSTQNAISTVGLLLGIGTVSSVLMITFVLPALLYLLDRFVLGLSWRR